MADEWNSNFVLAKDKIFKKLPFHLESYHKKFIKITSSKMNISPELKEFKLSLFDPTFQNPNLETRFPIPTSGEIPKVDNPLVRPEEFEIATKIKETGGEKKKFGSLELRKSRLVVSGYTSTPPVDPDTHLQPTKETQQSKNNRALETKPRASKLCRKCYMPACKCGKSCKMCLTCYRVHVGFDCIPNQELKMDFELRKESQEKKHCVKKNEKKRQKRLESIALIEFYYHHLGSHAKDFKKNFDNTVNNVFDYTLKLSCCQLDADFFNKLLVDTENSLKSDSVSKAFFDQAIVKWNQINQHFAGLY